MSEREFLYCTEYQNTHSTSKVRTFYLVPTDDNRMQLKSLHFQ